MRIAPLLGTALAANCAPGLAPVVPGVAGALGIPLRMRRSDAAGITFDDGPHPRGTPAVLRALEREDARATFFVAGEQVAQRPALAAEIVAAGHEVALHCHRHRNMLRLTPRQIRDDLRRGEAEIADATGVRPRLQRPPYGIFSAVGLAIARRAWTPLLWSRWGRDWRADATAESIAALASDGIEGGDVVLLHDSDAYSAADCWRATAEAVPRILDALRGAGVRPLPAGEGLRAIESA
jgi:peptidoglycan/xylan/chitin deacetylase (PgdA/CDA1 family)